MELNVLHPLKAVQSGLDKPDVGLGFFLVLLPTLIAFLVMLLLGFPINFLLVVVNLFKGVANWIVLGIVIYILAYLVRGKEVAGRFSGILSAASLIWVLALIVTLIGIVFVLSLGSQVLDAVKTMATGVVSAEEAGKQLAVALANSSFSPAWGLGLFAFGILLAGLALLILFFLVSDMLPKSRLLTKLVVWAAALLIWLNLSAVIVSF
ncbi:MAG: hypothetical protein J4215_03680 [Candidatus Diapherotrites archaeon]|uniref:Yip1 domain-containing protein n=1 Tax=Candidatus Iainarchaeum sp. TaxID=3101447 RepID=A0A8T4L2V7_9ARCH|nr:hypothetical protein [Candidatus Diapherotrites archaeon]